MQNPGNAEIIINFSGGKDSTAMLLYLCEGYPLAKKHVVFADTGWEHPNTYQWCCQVVSDVRKVYNIAEDELKLHRVASFTKDFFKMVRNRKMFPAPAMRQCTSDLKRGPIHKWIRNNTTSGPIYSAMGLRAEESAARAKKAQVAINKTLTNSKRIVYDWLPIQYWTGLEVKKYIKNRGLELHPVYNYLDRFSCRVCIFNSARELAAIEANDPEAIDIISKVEQEIGFTMKPEGSIRKLIDEYNKGEQIAFNM